MGFLSRPTDIECFSSKVQHADGVGAACLRDDVPLRSQLATSERGSAQDRQESAVSGHSHEGFVRISVMSGTLGAPRRAAALHSLRQPPQEAIARGEALHATDPAPRA